MCATYLICGIDRVSDEVLTHSFFNFIDPTEARALKLCLSHNGSPEDMHDIIVSMLSRFSCTTIPTESNLGELVNQVAQFTLFCQPFYALFEMRRGMIASHPSLWQVCNSTLPGNFYNVLRPTVPRVWDMIIEPTFRNVAESRVFDYLRRFIFSLLTE